MKVFLAGYSQGNGRSYAPENLLQRAEQLNAFVLDVRYKPFSTLDPRWGKDPLKELMGSRYRWFGAWWGNRSVGTGEINIADFDRGLEEMEALIARKQPEAVILLCGCRSAHGCHRGVLGSRLNREYGYPMDNLNWKIKTTAQLALSL